MNGAELLMGVACDLGLEVCFANPGTTEMPLVNALDRIGGIRNAVIRGVPGLHENVCTGAADGYARIAEKPALTLLHLGPGFANGLANLHNARRARSPVVNLIGEHATWHQSADAPLHSEIERLTGWAGAWTRRSARAADLGRDLADALGSATSGRGQVASLILPHDLQLEEVAAAAPAVAHVRRLPAVDADRVRAAALLLARARRPVLLLGGAALFGAGLEAAGRLAERTGAALIGEVGFARMAVGKGLPRVQRLPYFPEQAAGLLGGFDAVVVAGTKLPVSFFGYHDKPARYLEGRDDVVHLADDEGDARAALEALLAELPAGGSERQRAEDPPLAAASGGEALDPATIGAVLAAEQPADAIVVVTAVSSAAPYGRFALDAPPHTQLALTGGAIGEGLALALGAAVAAPDRQVIAFEADGSGAYIMQALWSQARLGAKVVTVICANRRYRILEMEQERAGIEAGPIARGLTTLEGPELDWVGLARAMGVPGEAASSRSALTAAIRRGLAEAGPYLIEARF